MFQINKFFEKQGIFFSPICNISFPKFNNIQTINKYLPDEGGINPINKSTKVDLPEPLSPIIAIRSPLLIFRLMPLNRYFESLGYLK